MIDYAELLTAASQLPVEIRIQFINELWETMPERGVVELSPEWNAEIERRSAEIEAGTVELVDWQTVRADLLRRVGLDRAT